jgi:hypothetical protein
MSEFTADQARALSESGLENRLAAALKEIRETASKGHTSCLLLGGCTSALAHKLSLLGYGVERKDKADSLRVVWATEIKT